MRPTLTVYVPGEAPRVHELKTDRVTIGSGGDQDVVIDVPFVSRHHLFLLLEDGRAVLEPVPAGLAAVVTVQGRPLSTPTELGAPDYFRIEGVASGEVVTCVYEPATPDAAGGPAERVIVAPKQGVLTVGSAAGSDVGEGNPVLADAHAEVVFGDGPNGDVTLRDLSGGITLLDGQTVAGDVPFPQGATASLGNVRIRRDNGALLVREVGDGLVMGARRARSLPDEIIAAIDGRGGVGLEARNLQRTVGDGQTILDDVSLHILPRQFVVLVGLSGAGKSTLLNALAGTQPAGAGEVLVDGVPLYEQRERFRSAIGYVPQRDIVHMDLTPFEALDYAARLRLPAGTSASERHERVEGVLADLGMSARRDVRISQLSGGQIKRVSIGVELISQPQLLFLDEPTSGLDPVTETELMQLLRRLSDQGRTVVVITHATKNVMLADRVIFMVPGGRLAWYGPPAEALGYFAAHGGEHHRERGRMEFDEIYALLQDGDYGSAEDWAQRYRANPAHHQYVQEPLERSVASMRPRDGSRIAAVRGARALGQLLTVSARNVRLVTRDRFALLLILAAAPLLASLDFLITERDMFSTASGNAGRIITNTNTIIVNAMLVGALSQMREVIKDREIYRRESLVGLQAFPYLLSKVWLAAAFAAYQAVWWVGIRWLAVDMPGGWDIALQYHVTMALVTLAGMVLGLLASAASPTEDAVALIVALIVVPQVLFSGAHLPAHELNPVVRSQMDIMPSRWAFEALTSIGGHGKDLANDACWTDLSREERAALSPEEKAQCACLGEGMFAQCAFPGLGEYAPADASLITSGTLLAEGRLEADFQHYGPIYEVNVLLRWGALLGIIAGVFAIIYGVLRVRTRTR
ncbi:MAG: ATP-binding cassette domain-containing protein [Dehalococcoidia bacterium]|nr:ATP-binding cassette domain-containing protein [Dehalococcoidia bacterium]